MATGLTTLSDAEFSDELDHRIEQLDGGRARAGSRQLQRPCPPGLWPDVPPGAETV